jgi:hypothetical protein
MSETSEDLFEMANLYPGTTGLPMTVIFLIQAHQAGVARHISGEDGGQPAFDAFRGQSGAPKPHGPTGLSALRVHSKGKRDGSHSLSVR